jgi:KipI family sensor histidine kinase inhibitor
VTAPRIREAGDSALLLELDEAIDERINAHAIGIAAAVNESRLNGVRDIVPTFRSVAVHFDPLIVPIEAIRDVLRRAVDTAPLDVRGATVEIPVQYGGDAGPDLTDVASFAGVAAERAVAIHADASYRVFMLGFLPGFAYMGLVPEAIAMPRQATPRVKVPAGSVGVAGRQTGVYPRDSPGGWRIIGRTALTMFDSHRSQPALLQPGDTVRFVPEVRLKADTTSAGADVVSGFSRTEPAPSTHHITILRPGLFTTIQDLGRWGHQASGVPVSGPMDYVSHRVANALVGNDVSAATLEVTLLGPELRIEDDTVVAIAGADLGANVDGAVLPPHRPVICRSGSVLKFGQRRGGTRAYVAVAGGIGVTPVLGSRATHVVCGLGGSSGRAVAAGDRLPIGNNPSSGAGRGVDVPPLGGAGGARLRVLPGPQEDHFPDHAHDLLRRTRFTITPQSDRMGYRLSGGRIPRVERREMISDATFAGAVQVPPSGDPILLMADRQTTGGYPQIATVITADLPLAGQLSPGDWVEFQVCTRREAMSALIAQEGRLLALR